ncbi:hypothetical protein RIF29_38244 [Crotalaria pallida]|uniref:Cytochrome P450 n=1 Tax=Crotalaria pallida TaxID=3830 RepID=A0AAN9DYY3_CROPI
MGSNLPNCSCAENLFNKNQALPIETIFKLPAETPVFPPGEGDGFASRIIDLGGLQVSQISIFNKVWATYEGGSDNVGATVFEPLEIPLGFFMLGSYIQPNNKPLFGWVLVAKDVSLSITNGTLKQPVDYKLVWNSSFEKIKQDSPAYVWLPTAPDGYKAVGHVVTTTPDKPSVDKIRCVRADLTDQCEAYSWIWGPGKDSKLSSFNFFDARPSNRGTLARGVRVGTFVAQIGGSTTSPVSISCLKNTNAKSTTSMPNLQQIEAIVQAYSPSMYLHPDDEYLRKVRFYREYLTSSVNWYVSNGVLLYTKGEESKPVPIAPNGTNLPQGGTKDGAYWLDLPADPAEKERVKKGDLPSSKSYIHVKPMLGGTFTDIVMWIFYPFNGNARAKVGKYTIPLGVIGEHVGDWEHVALRVSNFNGILWEMYFSQHSKGTWYDATQLEFQSGNKPVVYSSFHGHATYPHAGLNPQGTEVIGLRNDTAKSEKVVDLGSYELVSAEYLGAAVIEPPWLNYFRQWGPTIDYNIDDELRKVEKILPDNAKVLLETIIKALPTSKPFHYLLSFLPLSLCVLLRLVKRSSFHNSTSNLPPGPWKLPLIGNLHQLAGSKNHHCLQDLAAKYGPIMHLKLGEEPNIIVITSAEIAHEIMKTHDINFSNRPEGLFFKIYAYNSTDIESCSYGDYWRQLKKICTIELLSTKRVQLFRSIREDEVSKLVKTIIASEGSVVNLSEMISSVLYGIPARAAFREKNRNHQTLVSTIKESIQLEEDLWLAELHPSMRVLQMMSRAKAKIEQLHIEADIILQDILDDHRNRNRSDCEIADNLLDVLLKFRKDEDSDPPLTDDNIKAIIQEMFAAGGDTTSNVVAWGMSEMIKNPKVMEQARVEVRRVYASKGYVDESELHQLIYLKSVIKETLRLHPPAPTLLPRENRESCSINGYEIPAKSKVLINVWAIGRDPKYWPEAESFKPERFLNSPIDYRGTNFEFIPFGAGRRICPGITFATFNMELLLAHLLYHFDWKLPNGMKIEELDMTETAGVSVKRKYDLCLIPIARMS